MRKCWTKKEINILREKAESGITLTELEIELPNRTRNSIELKAGRLGIKIQPESQWNDHDIRVLEENYSTKSFDNLMLLLPSKTIEGIKGKAARLGLKRERENFYSDEEKRIISEKYSTITNSDLSEITGRSVGSIQNKARKMGLKKKGMYVYKRKHEPKIEKWVSQDPDFCYLLGILMADGSISNNAVSLRLKEDDQELIEKIHSLFGGYVVRGQKTVENKIFKHVGWHCSGDDVIEILNNNCLIENKTFRTSIPNMPEENMKDFIRGYFDGDGCILEYDSGCYKYGRVTIVGYNSLLESLREKILEVKNINSYQKIKKSSKGNCFELNYNRQNDVVSLFEFFYYPGCLNMERKYRKFQEVVRNIRGKNL